MAVKKRLFSAVIKETVSVAAAFTFHCTRVPSGKI